jgi:hypothetical protein
MTCLDLACAREFVDGVLEEARRATVVLHLG